jgi:putative hydrolase of the HAD superfamily
MVEAVTFDFWGTIAQDSPETLEAQRILRVRALCTALFRAGVSISEDETAEGYARSGDLLWERFWNHHRDPGLAAQVRLVLECCAPGVTGRMPDAVLDEAIEGYVVPTLVHRPALVPGAADAVRELAAHGIALGIVSNTGRTPGRVLRQLLEQHDLLRYFAAVTYSDEVGCRKPHREIFHLTLARIGVGPAAAAHVGDNPVDDVAGARDAGMIAVHYTAANRPAALAADLAIGRLCELAPGLFRVAS